MKGPGILSMVQLAAGLSIAGPFFFMGIEYTRMGRILGGLGFFGLGLVALYAPTYFINRIGGPRAWIRRRFRRRTDDPTETTADEQTEPRGEDESTAISPRERLRRWRR